MGYFEKMLSKLPSVLNSEVTSNNAKLLNIITEQMEELKEVYKKILLYRDIDSAEGATLDRIGVNVNQTRNGLDDRTYRLLLKTKIQQNISKGDVNTIIEIAATLLNIDYTDIYVKNLKDIKPDAEPAHVVLSAPQDAFEAIGGKITTNIVAPYADMAYADEFPDSFLVQLETIETTYNPDTEGLTFKFFLEFMESVVAAGIALSAWSRGTKQIQFETSSLDTAYLVPYAGQFHCGMWPDYGIPTL